MQCGDPILCYTGKKRKIYRNWSMASPLIRASAQSVFDCGKCLHCRRKRSNELAMRCVLHASLYTHNMFLTLTYDESHPDYHNELCYADIQKFKKKLRRHVHYQHGRKIEIFNVHEYGKNGKKHWHLIVFGYDFSEKPTKGKWYQKLIHSFKNKIPLYTHKKLEKMWGHGFVTIGDVSMASALYQAQYTQKDFKNGNTQNKKKSKSNHSGIGKPYFEKHYAQLLTLGAVPFGSRFAPLPRYFEKLAHRHWCHFHEPSAFYDIPGRKRIYSPFKEGSANERISNLYAQYIKNKKQRIALKEEKWKNEIIQPYLENGVDPDFMKSLKNSYYDLKNKQTQEKF